MTDYSGQQIGNYCLEKKLKSGGFGDIYLGQHIYLKRYAAIKVLQAQLASEDVEQFYNEARTIAKLRHPHIAVIFEFHVENGTPFLAMEYALKGNLRDLHPKKTTVALETVVKYVKQIAAALQYAHNQQVIHRDVKPENILLGDDGEIRLCDFGIAIVVTNSRRNLHQNQAGTATYMAPEQIEGEPEFASDQYALGVVVYEWLCGEPPFNGDSIQVAMQHLNASPPSLCEKKPNILPEVEEVVLKALQKDPAQRYRSVQDFAKALERSVMPVKLSQEESFYGEPTSSAPFILPGRDPSFIQQPDFDARQKGSLAYSIQPHRSPQKRGIPRRTVLEVVAGLFILGTWLELAPKAWSIIQTSVTPTSTPLIATHTPTRAVTPAQSVSPTPTVTPGYTHLVYSGHTAIVTDVAWSPYGNRIASASFDKTVQVWDVSNGEPILTYTGHNSQVLSVAWSPDGKYIASCSAAKENEIHVWDANNGKLLNHPLSGHTDTVNAVVWSPDSKRIASASFDGTVRVWRLDEANHYYVYWHTNTIPASTYRHSLSQLFDVAWSPYDMSDGPFIVVSSGLPDATVVRWDATVGDPATPDKVYKDHTDNVLSVAWSPDGKYIVSGSADKTAKVWDANNAVLVYTYHGHTGDVRTVAWSRIPGSMRVASGSWDNEVHVWDAPTGENVFRYQKHSSGVWSVAWSPSGQMIASAGADNTVRVWQAD